MIPTIPSEPWRAARAPPEVCDEVRGLLPCWRAGQTQVADRLLGWPSLAIGAIQSLEFVEFPSSGFVFCIEC